MRSRLMSDVPLGAFLSGGIDSSIIVACMARASARRSRRSRSASARAITTELPYARLVAERYRTDHHEGSSSPTRSTCCPASCGIYGEPFADTSAVPTRVLCEMTRKHVTVALSGDAGDEAFGGYKRYVWAHVAHAVRSACPRPRGAAPRRAAGRVPGGPARWLREYGRAPRAPTRRCTTCASSATSRPTRRPTSTRPSYARASRATRPPNGSPSILAARRGTDPVSRLLDLDSARYLPDDILDQGRHCEHDARLEVRAPFVDTT